MKFAKRRVSLVGKMQSSLTGIADKNKQTIFMSWLIFSAVLGSAVAIENSARAPLIMDINVTPTVLFTEEVVQGVKMNCHPLTRQN